MQRYELRDEQIEEDPFDPEDPSFFDVDEDDEEPPERTWIKKVVAALVALMLLGNILAFLPQIYSLDAIKFLRTNYELSKDEQIQQFKRAIVVVGADGRRGTGFNISRDGLIITNEHIVGDEKTAAVSFPQGDKYIADVVVRDASIDIAVLQVQGSAVNLPTLDIDWSPSWEAGHSLRVIGNPLLFYQIANEGTILGLTPLSDWDLPVMMLQAPIYKGNSGSPVIDDNGKVIAVVFATMKRKVGDQTRKVGLAVPIEYVKPYVDRSTSQH